jgi:group I intron endonuclease
MCEIYLVTNSVNGKVYVGKTKYTGVDRFEGHVKSSKRKKSDGRRYSKCALACAIRKYGEGAFSVSTLASNVPEEEIDAMEKIWVVLMNAKVPNGYNMADGGNGPKGCAVSKRTRKLHSKNSKERWDDPNFKKKLSKIHKARMTPEILEVHKKASEDLWKDPEYRSKVCDALKGKTAKRWTDPEYKKRMQEIQGSVEYRNKMHDTHSDPKHKAERSKIMKGWWAEKKAEDPNFKLNISEEGKARAAQKTRDRWTDPNYKVQIVEKSRKTVAEKILLRSLF